MRSLPLLQGYRGSAPADIEALADAIVKLSALALALRKQVVSIDVNPMIVNEHGLVAVDALKELPIALLLRPIGFNTLPIWTFNLATESRFEQAALPALAIIVVAMIPVALLSRQLSRGTERA